MKAKEMARRIVNFKVRGLPIFFCVLLASLTLFSWRMGTLTESDSKLEIRANSK